MILLIYLYKGFKHVVLFLRKLQWIVTYCKFKLNRITFIPDFTSNGIPITAISLKSKVIFGKNFVMNNGMYYNMIGRQQPCFFIVPYGGLLKIGDNVGISSTAFVCWNTIEIGNNVKIGGGSVIYDTDFHSLDYKERMKYPENRNLAKTAPVIIKDNVFIGTNCTILKGVTIGENAIIGACSVVTKTIPSNEIWAGNPAKFIRKIKSNE